MQFWVLVFDDFAGAQLLLLINIYIYIYHDFAKDEVTSKPTIEVVTKEKKSNNNDKTIIFLRSYRFHPLARPMQGTQCAAPVRILSRSPPSD